MVRIVRCAGISALVFHFIRPNPFFFSFGTRGGSYSGIVLKRQNRLVLFQKVGINTFNFKPFSE